MWDMGLGTNATGFVAISEDEYEEMSLEAEEKDVMPNDVVEIYNSSMDVDLEDDEDGRGDDVNLLLLSAGQPGMGNR